MPIRWLLRTCFLLALSLAACSGGTTAGDPPPITTEDAKPATAPYKNALKWSTASEMENFGYDVYRGLSEEGPFERITPDPLPGAGTTDETNEYEFVDDTINPYTDYYYYVESISLSGARERFTPILKAKAKLPGGAGEKDP